QYSISNIQCSMFNVQEGGGRGQRVEEQYSISNIQCSMFNVQEGGGGGQGAEKAGGGRQELPVFHHSMFPTFHFSSIPFFNRGDGAGRERQA
ncbi:MAG: hypothetical protein PHI39_10065, partial [Kiritimatiellae bacterium]|nr:hypothetical protein [Kiritimatiellia bacterium]